MNIDDIKQYIPSYYRDGTNLAAYLQSMIDQFSYDEQQISILKSNLQLDTATGADLDLIGRKLQLGRDLGENDTDYRERIKSYLSTLVTKTTIPGFKKVIEDVFGFSTSDYSYTEESGKFIVEAHLTGTNNQELTLLENLNNIRAAGVLVILRYYLDRGVFVESQYSTDNFTIYDVNEGKYMRIDYTRMDAVQVDDFVYKIVNINNSSGVAQTDYQINITLTSSDLGFWSQCTNQDTIYFRDSDNVGLLSFYVESFDTITQTASIWVKIPNLPASNYSIYMYYGQNSAYSSYNSADNTFALYDDFIASTFDSSKWNVSGGITVGSGEVHCVSGSYITSKLTFGLGYKAIFDYKLTSGVCYTGFQTGGVAALGGYASIGCAQGTMSYNTTFKYSTESGMTAYHSYEIRRISSNLLRYYQDGLLLEEVTAGAQVPSGNLVFGIKSSSGTFCSAGSGYLKAIKILKTQAVEPTVTII